MTDVIYNGTKIGFLMPPLKEGGYWLGIPLRYSKKLGWQPAQELHINDKDPEKVRDAIVNGPLNVLRTPTFKEYHRDSGLIQDAEKSPRGFVVGDRVILPANEEEGWTEERGTVIALNDQYSASDPRSINNHMIVVEIDEKYREEDDFDGLRECGDDQVERES